MNLEMASIESVRAREIPDPRGNPAIEADFNSTGYKAGRDCFIALDQAVSSFYQGVKYVIWREGAILPTVDVIDYCARLVSKYPIISIEDCLVVDDWAGWILLTAELGKEVQLVGDGLYITNVERLERGIREKASNTILSPEALHLEKRLWK